MRRGERGIVLVLVLFFTLLLASSVATFAKRALIDHLVVHNRNARAQADALARGGIRLATMLLLEDKIHEAQGLVIDHSEEPWAIMSGQEIPLADGSTLTLRIEDAAARLNLNAVVSFDEAGNPDESVEPLLMQLLEQAIREIPRPPGEKVYDVAALTADLIDYIDTDELSLRGGDEADPYQRRDPPTRPPSRGALLWVDELRNVEGFDADLVESLRPYVTVYPYHGGGINPNTAPPHILGLLFYNDGVSFSKADEDLVREILRVRGDGQLLCAEEQSGEGCVPISTVVTNANSLYPAPRFTSDVFVVTAQARVGEIQRSIEAVLDRSEGVEPLLLSWRVL